MINLPLLLNVNISAPVNHLLTAQCAPQIAVNALKASYFWTEFRTCETLDVACDLATLWRFGWGLWPCWTLYKVTTYPSKVWWRHQYLCLSCRIPLIDCICTCSGNSKIVKFRLSGLNRFYINSEMIWKIWTPSGREYRDKVLGPETFWICSKTHQ
jgi:hypothetical protein